MKILDECRPEIPLCCDIFSFAHYLSQFASPSVFLFCRGNLPLSSCSPAARTVQTPQCYEGHKGSKILNPYYHFKLPFLSIQSKTNEY